MNYISVIFKNTCRIYIFPNKHKQSERRLLQTRHLIGQSGATHVPDLAIVITTGTVHGDSVVPHHQIPLVPDVNVNKLPLRGVFRQVAQE